MSSDTQPSQSAVPPAPKSGPRVEFPNGAKGPDALPFADYRLSMTQNPTDEDIQGTSDISRLMLDYHNQMRRMYGANDLVWDAELAAQGRDHASQCLFMHDNAPRGNGNNIHSEGSTGDLNVSAQSTLDGYAIEFEDFDWNTYDLNFGNGGPMVGHFTQMVWKDTTRVGCGWSFNCTAEGLNLNVHGKGFMSSCMYLAPGNIQDEVRENVGAYAP